MTEAKHLRCAFQLPHLTVEVVDEAPEVLAGVARRHFVGRAGDGEAGQGLDHGVVVGYGEEADRVAFQMPGRVTLALMLSG